MPMRRNDYPANWEELRVAVRARSGDACEHPGEVETCNAPNRAQVHRLRSAAEYYVPCTAHAGRCGWCADPEWSPAVRIVLTVAHTCQDSTCDDLTHLRHWCQLHHLRYDAAQHGRNAAATRRRKREAATA